MPTASRNAILSFVLITFAASMEFLDYYRFSLGQIGSIFQTSKVQNHSNNTISLVTVNTLPIKSLPCLNVRGKSGHWIAKTEDSNFELIEKSWDRTTEFPPSVKSVSTYYWKDDHENCSITVATLNNTCSTLQRLGITKLLFVGDSLTSSQVQSLWNLMGYTSGLPENNTVYCPESNGFTFRIDFIRNDRLSTNPKDGPCPGDGICNVWVENYLDNNIMETNGLLSKQHRIVLVANTGAHLHTKEGFVRRFENFLKVVDTQRDHDQDWVIFRTTVPGHFNCSEHDRPYEMNRNSAKLWVTIIMIGSKWNRITTMSSKRWEKSINNLNKAGSSCWMYFP